MEYNKNMDYFGMWTLDKESIIACMVRNMQADLDMGYDPNGRSIKDQQMEIHGYRVSYEAQFDILTAWATHDGMDPVNRWCYMDMKRRGAIS